LQPRAYSGDHYTLMVSLDAKETTIALNKVPVLAQPWLQILIVITNLIFGLVFGGFLGVGSGFRWPYALAGATWGGIAGILAARKLGRAGAPLSVTVDATHLRILMPKERVVEVPLEEVRSIEERIKKHWRMLIISTKQRPFVFPWVAFGADLAERLRQTVRAAVALRPKGPELVAAMERREQLGRELMGCRPLVLWVLVSCICLVFAVEVAAGALGSPALLLSLGGNASVLVADGQWWRLFTATFLHGSWLHFGLNFAALAALGGLLERLVGSVRMLAISLVAGFGGSLASALTSTHVFSVGISGMLFGMIGAVLVVNLRSRDALPGGFHIGWGRWILLLGLNALISLLPGVDGMAHLGGLISGAAVAVMVVPKDLDRSQSRFATAVVGGLLAIGDVSAFGMVLAAPRDAARTEFLHAALDNPRLSAASLNAVAWSTAINPVTTSDELAAIEHATRRLVDENPRNTSYRDTYAYVLHREGYLDKALEQERIALIDIDRFASDARLYTMFLRFLTERGSVNPGAATVRRHGRDIIVESTIPGAVIFAGKPEHGLVRIILPKDVREARVAAPRLLTDDELPVWLVDGSGPEQRISTAQINFALRDAATAALP
jgi:membrane associated rhomboid family serine protease